MESPLVEKQIYLNPAKRPAAKADIYIGGGVAMDATEPFAKNARKSVRTSPKLRKAIQNSRDPEAVAARRFGVHRKTVAKWRARLGSRTTRWFPGCAGQRF
jgi:hypothetical protein